MKLSHFHQKALAIFLLNLAGLIIFFSWYLPAQHGIWLSIDTHIFYFFNQYILPDTFFASFVAYTNNRKFDLVILLVMGALYYNTFRKKDHMGKRHLIIVGLLMVISAVLINQIGQNLPIERPSPTLHFQDVNRVSVVTNIPTKDASGDSFPGDHGLMLLIFCSFILRYLSFRSFVCALLITVIFSLPRVMAGAHWASDILVGSISLTLITTSWLLITPLSDIIVRQLEKYLPFKK
ncbi:phosphatase PAP2 family protein [Proteus faecis]|uniref:Lipid A 1-diphosphate synthase n=1 Tax=Proteus faecis TaxID=2050967 RepID=A0AAW7CQR4_9GAMM|nr:phosphatase PAP2 family protein [Proteus faecis]MBG3014399.1 phosphatase PAP2 family protein [Proteus mirabilis]MDL5165912.1 phosphatase PAP2 family protein [Proteus faecis]MDL5273824.1 phosphatase PAP2 family protein [Proteus faecis]MDL5277394.1 phosphatase PAP2 family protein [Proteus faecis]MDL5306384.1 phosphatase PAP2 family protein [Proteus faecis]